MSMRQDRHSAFGPIAHLRVTRFARLLGAMVLSLGLAGCALQLPPLPERPASVFLPGEAGSPLAVAAAAPGIDTTASGLTLLRDPMQALASRVLLARSAQRSLDVQVYIFHPDVSGRLLMHELWRAAERGVRVRLLVDDNGSEGMDSWMQALERHPRIEVRLFNPFPTRGFKAAGYLTEFTRLNRRMHNKSFTADALATIVGGRNIGDVYYGVDETMVFADLDLLALGPVARDTAANFDGFWNSASSWPVSALLPTPEAAALQPLTRVLADPSGDAAVARLLAELRRYPWLSASQGALVPRHWAATRLLSDSPTKLDGGQPAGAPGTRMLEPLTAWLGTAERTLDLVSPYFVPGEAGVKSLADLARRGVKVRIITNSLAATDVMAVHAGYARHRRALLLAGVEIHELKPDAAARDRAVRLPWRMRLAGYSAASLHGKTFLVDGRRLFVGSFNLDPRSAVLNTEMGLTVDDATITLELAQALERDLPMGAWRVVLGAEGELQWVERSAEGRRVLTGEPGASLARRLGAKLLSWLPIEGLL
jgi:putative cardiolipin synthase